MEKIYFCVAFLFVVSAFIFYFANRAKRKVLEILSRDYSYKEKKMVFSNIKDLYGFCLYSGLLVLVLGLELGESIVYKGLFSLEAMVMFIVVVFGVLMAIYVHQVYRKLVDMC